MTTVSTSEAVARLPELLKQGESVVIREDGDDVAVIVALPSRVRTEEERSASWARLQELSQHVSADLERDLAKDGRTVDQFLADALADE